MAFIFRKKSFGTPLVSCPNVLDGAVEGIVGGGGLPTRYISGRYYTQPVSGNLSTRSVSANNGTACFLFVSKRQTFTAIGIYCTANASAGDIKVGIYRDEGGVPTSLIYGSEVTVAAITAAAATDATFSTPITLEAGAYWIIGLVSQTMTFTANSASGTPMANYIGFPSMLAASTSSGVGFSFALTYGALPSTCPTLTLTEAVSNPVFGLKAQ